MFEGTFMRPPRSGIAGRSFGYKPQVRYIGTAQVSGSALDLAAAGARPGDMVLSVGARGFATPPVKPADWSEVWPAYSAATPFYHVGWAKSYQAGDLDPQGSAVGIHRVGIWRNARVKAGSASTLYANSANISVPAKTAGTGDVAVAVVAQSGALSDIISAIPGTLRWSRPSAPAMGAGEGTGWAQKDTTVAATGMYHSAAFILEPHNGFVF